MTRFLICISCLWAMNTASLSFAASAKPQKKLSPSEVLKKTTAAEWRDLDPDNTLYMKLESGGLVVMELHPDFAPLHVENIKKIAASGYWDGLAMIRSQDNFVVSWGDPGEMKKPPKPKPLKKGIAKTLPPEFERKMKDWKGLFPLEDGDVYAENVGFYKSLPIGWEEDSGAVWRLHCYGTLGVGRGEDLNSGNGTGLYVVTGQSPRYLDRNIAIVGQVFYGIEHLSTLPRGTGPMGFYEKPSQYTKVLWVKKYKDLTKAQRLPLEVLKTSSQSFKDYLEARRNRPEKWFHRPAGRIEVCSGLPKARLKK